MGPQLIFLGAPGAGKGTQASRLAREFGFRHVSTGDLLRREVDSNSPLGARVRSLLDEGVLLDDGMILEIVKANCDLGDGARYIFDGLPRNVRQARDLDRVILGDVPSRAFHFEVGLDELVERLVNRRSCPSCGRIFNLVSGPPRAPDTCDACGRRGLDRRKDDEEEVVRERLAIFRKEIGPILDHYRAAGRLVGLDASRGSDEVFGQIRAHLGLGGGPPGGPQGPPAPPGGP